MSDATTIDAHDLAPGDGGPGGSSYLVVREGERADVYDLADGDEIVIGRGSEVTVQIGDARASRRHAAVRREGARVTLADLGSRNGTRLNQETLRDEERAIGSGDVIRIGEVELVLAGTSGRTRGGAGRLERELRRLADAGGGRAALVRIALDPETASLQLDAMAPAFAGAALVEAQGEGEYACLLGDRAAAEALAASVARLAPGARVGVVRFPDDGATLAALWERAREGRPERAGASVAEAPPAGVVVADPAMARVFERVRKVAATPTAVLLLGETGVGKEVLAETIHRMSPRASKPCVRLNCAALSETLLESELFGHERGAFTGANQVKPGLLETAEGGTVFLDEAGDLPLPLQAKLLRVIEERQVLRVGGLKPRPIDVRFLAATNRDLELEVLKGTFRQDLFFRLNGVTLTIPPLRERVSEIEPLARAFVAQFCARSGRSPAPAISTEALELLKRYSWPGNIRELRNVIERAVLLCPSGSITLEHLPVEKMRATRLPPPPSDPTPPPRLPPPAPATTASSGEPPPPTWREEDGSMDVRREIAQLERRRILDALDRCAGNQTQAATLLGISRRTLVNRLDAYAIARPRKGRSPLGK